VSAQPAQSPSTSASSSPASVGRAVAPPRTVTIRVLRPNPVVAHFRLARPAVVHVSVWEQAPACRFLGRYRVHAQRGRNVLRLRRQIGARHLRAGTYEFVALALGRRVLSVRVRVGAHRNRLLAVHRTKRHTVCSAAGGAAAGVELAATSPAASSTGVSRQQRSGTSGTDSGGTRSASGPQSAPFRPPTQSTTPPGLASPASAVPLFVLLALAIALLGAATVPERVPAGAAVARHRPLVAVGGLALLLAAAVLLFA
jgi:hypothetical protein